MKQILVIGSLADNDAEAASLQQMRAFVENAVGADKATVFACHLDQVGYYISVEKTEVTDMVNDRDLKEYDLVFFRGKLAASINVASTIAQYLQDNGVPQVNTAYAKRRAVGKLPQMMQLVRLGLPIPKTVTAASAYLPALIKKHLSYPVIVKDVQGAHGDNNYLVQDGQQLAKILQEQPELQFMAQEFIANQGDFRVLLMGSEVAVIHRQSQGDSHLNNTSVGGRATLVETGQFPMPVIEQSRQFAQLCEYEISGVDVIFDSETNQHYFLEINSQPQLMTGAEVPLKTKMLGNYFSQLLDL